MSFTPQTQLLKRMSTDLVPDLTKSLKLFKTRISLLNKILKQPSDNYHQLIQSISSQETQLISKYEGIDSFLLSGYQMEFQRLFCRMIQTLQSEKKNTNLESYISQIEGIIYETITNNKSDYITALSRIYGKGRGITKIIMTGDSEGGKNCKMRSSILSISKTEKRIPELRERKEREKSKFSSMSLKNLTGLDLDLNYRRDSYLYIPNHQEETLSEMSERNRWISGDISMYQRVYTENTLKKQRRSEKARRLIIHQSSVSMSEAQMSPVSYNPQSHNIENGQTNNIHLKNKANTTTVNSFKNYRAFSMSKQNKKYIKDPEGKTSYSFRQTQQSQTLCREITPKKIFFCFNKLALRPADDTKPAQFNIRKKNKQVCQTKIKVKESMFQILIQGKKIEDDMLELIDIRRKISAKVNSNLFV